MLAAMKNDAATQKAVRPGNLIDMSSATILKGSLAPADTSEVVLAQGPFVLKPFGSNSLSGDFQQSYPIIITQDNLALINGNAVKWAVLGALFRMNPNAPDLGLYGLVRGWNITDGRDDMFGMSRWKRDSSRLVSLLTINVDFYVPRATLATA